MPANKPPSKIQDFLQDRRKLLINSLLVLILMLGAFLRIFQMAASGVGNVDYAAVAKSRLQSWNNYFFVAFEPGGSLSVDEPPVGLWVPALSAYFRGLNGFALALPEALAGVLSIFCKLIPCPFGAWAALLAAPVLTITPVAISAENEVGHGTTTKITFPVPR